MKTQGAVVDPDLYSEEYFLSDNEGWREYAAGLDTNIHPKFARALQLAGICQGERVLDAGCGRGELVYYAARRGAHAIGIDYSKAAVSIAARTLRMLPGQAGALARCDVGDVCDYPFEGTFDVVFMIEIAEHMHDWQLEKAFRRIHDLLKPGGRLIIMTPNCLYERYLSPAKRLMNIPINLIKWPARVVRGKYKPRNPAELARRIFKVSIDRGELNRKMHVNVTTPRKMKALLSGYDARVWCEDHSRNILSLILAPWFGRDIIAVARKIS